MTESSSQKSSTGSLAGFREFTQRGKRSRIAGLLGALVGAALLLVSCGTTGVGELRDETRTVELEGAESVRAQLRMGAGELRVSGGAGPLMEANFRYNVPEWEPEVSYEVSEGTGRLLVEQGSGEDVSPSGDSRNEWDVRLNDQVPTDLDIEMGAGESDFELGTMNLTGLNIDVGAGASTVDLTGERDRDLDAAIRGGAGEATLLLPENVGVRVDVRGGLGQVNAEGLSRQRDAYVNDAYNESDTTLRVRFEGGVGQLNLEVED